MSAGRQPYLDRRGRSARASIEEIGDAPPSSTHARCSGAARAVGAHPAELHRGRGATGAPLPSQPRAAVGRGGAALLAAPAARAAPLALDRQPVRLRLPLPLRHGARPRRPGLPDPAGAGPAAPAADPVARGTRAAVRRGLPPQGAHLPEPGLRHGAAAVGAVPAADGRHRRPGRSHVPARAPGQGRAGPLRAAGRGRAAAAAVVAATRAAPAVAVRGLAGWGRARGGPQRPEVVLPGARGRGHRQARRHPHAASLLRHAPAGGGCGPLQPVAVAGPPAREHDDALPASGAPDLPEGARSEPLALLDALAAPQLRH